MHCRGRVTPSVYRFHHSGIYEGGPMLERCNTLRVEGALGWPTCTLEPVPNQVLEMRFEAAEMKSTWSSEMRDRLTV